MKNLRPFGLWLALAALLALGCQTVTRLYAPPTPTLPPPPQPTAPLPAATRAGSRATATPLALPTLPSDSAVPLLGTPAEAQKALADSSSIFLEMLAPESYTDAELAEMNRTFSFTIVLGQEQPLLWQYGWCATTQAILKQNLQLMSVAFEMNGAPVPEDQSYAYDSQSSGNLECHSYVALVYNWPKGKTSLQTTVTFDAKLNDGMSDYGPGQQTFAYTVTR